MTRLVAILGSVTPPGRLSSAVQGVLDYAAGLGTETELLDLGRLRLDFADGRPAGDHDDDSARVIEAVSSATSVLIASPVYRGSYTGALKNLLDLLPVDALRGKPVGILAMGGSAHHYLGVDWHLRDVLAWFGALLAPTSVYLASADFTDGVLNDSAAQSLHELVGTLEALSRLAGEGALGPAPLAARRS